MSGGSVPYHLRQNKAVERNTFIELLQSVNRIEPIKDYTYVSFGGPYLEDFKWIHSALGLTKMISIEMDETVYARQSFNQPFGLLDCKHRTSGDFISHDIDDSTPYIFWLDYASPNEIKDQLIEFSQLIAKLKPMDIIKITLNANPKTLGDPPTVKDKVTGDLRKATVDDKNEQRLHRLKSNLSEFLPPNLEKNSVSESNLPSVLLSCLKKAANKATQGSNQYCQPCSSFVYKDSEHQMLTLTLAILEKDSEKKIRFQDEVLKKWDLSNSDWDSPTKIFIPELSIRERLYLDQNIHNQDPDDLMKELSFVFPERRDKMQIIESYKKFYRHLPQFSRVMV